MAERAIICLDVILIAALTISICIVGILPEASFIWTEVAVVLLHAIGILSVIAVYLNTLRSSLLLEVEIKSGSDKSE